MDGMTATLNAAQRSAVTSKSSILQVLAGPGSGKTKTLTARVAHLIVHQKLQPWNIIVCTFTVKAAREMKERIEGLLGPEVAGKLILGTFHSIARRYLAGYGEHIGLDQRFGIADTSDTKSIVGRVIKRCKLTIDPKVARHRISSLKAQGVSAEQHIVLSRNDSKKPIDAQEFSNVYSEYEEELRLAKLLDYDDLLLRCVELLSKHASCVSNIEAVLIDEFQDTNDTQYDLMQLFAEAKRTITIVGDPDQSIYGWRSAKIENLRKMQRQYPDTHVVKLEENYRSSALILFAADEVIQQDQARPQKSLTPTHSIGLNPVLRKLCCARIEADWLVSEVQRSMALTGGLLKWSDYAILLRSASLSRHIERALVKAGLPYRMIGGHRFYDRLEVRLLLDYLRVLDHPDNTDALLRVLNVPSRMIGDATLQVLLNDANAKSLTLWAWVLDIARGNSRSTKELRPQALKGVDRFVGAILDARAKLEDKSEDSLADFLEYLIRKMGIEAYLRDKYAEEFEGRWENVQQLVTQAAEASMLSLQDDGIFEDLHDERDEEDSNPSETKKEMLTKFLTNIALSTSAQDQSESDKAQEFLTISTMHAAKGLEWPVVFIPHTHQGSIPHSRSEDTDEERRLLYVAMTRAQALLYLSTPMKDLTGNNLTMSSFLSPNKTAAHFASKGSNLSFDIVYELAKILRRPSPIAKEIYAGRQTLQNLDDDQWPQFKPKVNEDYDAKLEPCNHNERSAASRPDNGSGTGGFVSARTLCNPAQVLKKPTSFAQNTVTTTLDQRGGFSEYTAMWSTNFVTAKQLVESAEKENLKPQGGFEKRSTSTVMTVKQGTKRKGDTLSKSAKCQRSIMSFMSGKSQHQ